MTTAFLVSVFVIGTIAGSFLSALLHRLRYGGSMVTGRSACVSCKQTLGAIDLIPVVSYLTRRGKCRMCKVPVSWQYLGLEVGMGVLALLAYSRGGFTTESVRLGVFLFFLLAVFVYDARHGEIPDALSVPGIVFALGLNLWLAPGDWKNVVLGTVVGIVFFGAQHLIGRGKWIGTGDIFLGAMVGAMTGWPGILATLFFGYVLGLIGVLVMLVSGRKKFGDAIPLAPFITAGAAIALLTDIGTKFLQLYAY